MKIPTSFKLMGDTLMTNGAESSDDNTNGTREQRFCRDLSHHILDRMAEYELSKSIQFVTIFGNLLHQALSTAEYELNDAPQRLSPPDEMYREPLTLRAINGDLLDRITDDVCQEEIEAKDLGRLHGGIVSCALDKVNARIREALGWDKRDTGYKGGRG
jgi:hypothetical protein